MPINPIEMLGNTIKITWEEYHKNAIEAWNLTFQGYSVVIQTRGGQMYLGKKNVNIRG